MSELNNYKNMKVQFCTFDEIAELINGEDRLVFIDDGIAETVGKYDDIPDIIVDLNLKFGNMDLKFYDFDGGITKPLLSTFGIFLNTCDPDVRKDIIERLVKLQTNEEKIKDYKLIDEYDLEEYYKFLDGNDEYGRNK
jgi:hypothetical protein